MLFEYVVNLYYHFSNEISLLSIYPYSKITFAGGTMTTADKIRSLREEYGLTQAMLAKRLCVSRSTVNAWELGIAVPPAALIVKLSKLFQVSSDHLLGIDSTATLDISGLAQEEIQILHNLICYFKSKKENA